MSSDPDTASVTDTTVTHEEGDGQVGDAPGAVEQVCGAAAADWANNYHRVLSVLEAEERLKEFHICGAFLVRRSQFKLE